MSYSSLLMERIFELKLLPASVIMNTAAVIKSLSEAGVLCPNTMGYGEDFSCELRWQWRKGDWRVAVEEQDRFAWDLVIEVCEHPEEGNDNCLFCSFDSRGGVSNGMKIVEKYFKHTDPIPEEAVEKIGEFETFIKEVEQ